MAETKEPVSSHISKYIFHNMSLPLLDPNCQHTFTGLINIYGSLWFSSKTSFARQLTPITTNILKIHFNTVCIVLFCLSIVSVTCLVILWHVSFVQINNIHLLFLTFASALLNSWSGTWDKIRIYHVNNSLNKEIITCIERTDDATHLLILYHQDS
jgi:hypothetical protein